MHTNKSDNQRHLATKSNSTQSGWQWIHQTSIGIPLEKSQHHGYIFQYQDHNIPRPKTNAFTALIKNGDSALPAPSEFIAFHRPGAMKPTAPMMKALNRVVWYHARFGVGCIEALSMLENTETGVSSIMVLVQNSRSGRMIVKFKWKCQVYIGTPIYGFPHASPHPMPK